MAVSLHIKLLTDIADIMETGSSEYDNFVFHMTQFVPKGILANKPNLLGKFNAMSTKGKLAVGKYEHLKKVARASGNNAVLELIQERETDILHELTREQSDGSVLDHNRRAENSGHSTTPATRVPATRVPSTRTASTTYVEQGNPTNVSQPGASDTFAETGKKRKVGAGPDHADPLYGEDRFQKGKYDTDGKRGYMLILNSTYKRKGLGNNIIGLEGLFRDQLGFRVETLSTDLTEDEVWGRLNETRTELNADTARQYYTFICVILTHGNEDGVMVKDKAQRDVTIDPVLIRKYFRNSEDMKHFTGRPKLFFIDCCRGGKAQELHYAKDEDDCENKEQDVVDESDEIFKIPTDADTLITMANTQGYSTFGDTSVSTTQYTCFTNALLDVFRADYRHDHVEEMLITVRDKVAVKGRKYYHAAECRQTKQMPCTWSTLTKRLYLAEFHS